MRVAISIRMERSKSVHGVWYDVAVHAGYHKRCTALFDVAFRHTSLVCTTASMSSRGGHTFKRLSRGTHVSNEGTELGSAEYGAFQ